LSKSVSTLRAFYRVAEAMGIPAVVITGLTVG